MLNKNVFLWQQATIEITRSLLSSPLVSTDNCLLASQALLEVTRLDPSIGITLLLHVCATYMGVILHAHPVCRESYNERNANQEVATPL